MPLVMYKCVHTFVFNVLTYLLQYMYCWCLVLCVVDVPVTEEHKGRMKEIGMLLHKLLSSSDSKVRNVHVCVLGV